MTKPLSRTAAIREARRHVSLSAFGRRQYVVYYPHDSADLTGPNRASTPRDYYRARRVCTEITARVALDLMGIRDMDTIFEIEEMTGSVETIVRKVAAKRGL